MRRAAWFALCALASTTLAQRDFQGEARQALGARGYENLRSICDAWVAHEDSLDTASLANATARTYRYIAHRSLGALGAAEDDARRAWELMRQLRGDVDVDTITAIGNVAGVRMLRGDLLEAEALYREVLALQRQLPSVSDASLARSYNNLAVVLRRQGSWADAEEMFRSSLELAGRSYGPEHRTTVLARRNLARTLRAQARFGEARAHLDSALASYDPSDSTRVAGTLQAMSALEFEAGDLATARELAERAYAMRRRTPGPGSTDAVHTLWMLGRIALASSDPQRAIELAREALNATERILGALHPEALRARVLLAEAQLVRGDAKSCLRTLETAPEIYELNLRSAAAGLDRATVDLPSPYPLLARARVAAGRFREAWDAAELSHAKTLGEVLDLRLGKLSDDQLSRRARLSQQLEDLRGELEATPEADAGFPGLRRELLQREAEWAQFERELAREQGLDAADLPQLEAIAALLREDELLIGWIDGHVWSLDAKAQLEWAVCSQDAPTEQLRARLLEAREAPAFAIPDEDDALQSLESQVAAAWFAPVWERMANRRRLWIIPHAELAGLPIAPLRDASGRSFVESFEIVLLPSASVWEKSVRAKRSGGGDAALFFGALPAGAPTHPRFARMPALRAAARELERCAALNSGARILSGDAASEATLRAWNRDGSLQRMDLLHFATHAVSDPMRPSRSALMAIAGDASGATHSASVDGALTAVEIADTWRLDARLVVLSACETALGRAVPGEGYVGIAHGFFQAGARSLLLSQWEADDEATSMLMEEFYRRWRGGSASSAAALAEAQRIVRARFPHPYFWAAFTLVGAAD